MTPGDLVDFNAYKLCTAKERLFVDAYCYADGDACEAVRAAYKTYTDAPLTSVRSKANDLLSRTHVLKCTDFIDGAEQPNQEETAALALMLSRTATSDRARLDALKLYVELKGLGKSAAPDPAKIIAETMKKLDKGEL